MRKPCTFESDNATESFGFCVTLFSDMGDMQNLWLPASPNGFFRISNDPEHHFLSIEERNGVWVARCNPPAYFQSDSLSLTNEWILNSCQLLEIEYEERNYSFYVQPMTKAQVAFRNYPVSSGVEISIGSHPDSDICYRNEFCGEHHALLERCEGKWHICAVCDEHGVYVNGRRITRAQLQLGDTIYIMGMRIIVGSNYLAISGTDGSVTVSQRILREFLSHGSYFRYSGQAPAAAPEQFFHRLPRKRLELAERTITVEGPPMSMEHAQMPLMLRMGSSMVMGGAAAMAGNFTTLISSVLFPLLSSKYTDKQKKEYEACRVTKYHEYLDAKRREIEEAGKDEHRILNQKFPALDKAVTQALETQGLWERRPIDSDFMMLRLGSGSQPLQAVIDYPPRRFSLDSDALEEEMYQMVESEHILPDMPVTIPLTENTSCGLLGPRELTLSFLRQLILQTAIFHSYDEVKMIFLANPDELALMEDIRFLPHVWDDQQSIRFVATNESEAYRIGEYLKAQFPEKLEDEKDLHQALKNRPYYLVLALDKKLFDSHEILKNILQSDKRHGVSVISVYDNLPKECQKIIHLSSNGKHHLTSLEQNGGEDIFFSTDTCEEARIAETMHMLANTKLKTVAQEQSLPKMLTFLEMFRAGTVEQLNSFTRWQDNNPVTSLSVPVGVNPDGSWFTLDLHEKRQGPHGLVAGMTGSGKSEFLISYILSMAVNYHPNEVAFVLIDYKGGGLAGAFENPVTGVKLPHLVGTITNLDGSTIQRSLMSIESELRRRQRVFNEVKSQLNEGTMDIYAYQKLYRAGKISEPMPHLFIISDEFAELKQQQPEFIDKLISTARIGRSLGVHLILATQKPSGVVNDQIRSNTKFRVCLRVQERSDSMDMLKRPEAAELTDTGRFYLQVGYNEYFALGQSAWCGAAYEPQAIVKKQRDDSVEFLDITGQTIAKTKSKGKKVKTDTTQLVAVVKYLSDLATSQGVKMRSLWPDELPDTYDLEDLQQKYPVKAKEGSLPVCLGVLDDPENQQQFPLTLDFAKCQNLLIAGTAGSGKTTMLQDILFTLAKNYSAEEVQFYILDFSSRTMKMFGQLPHCGAVLFEEDSDSLNGFFDLINGIVAERKKLFSELEVDSFEAARTIRKIPAILVVIDNLAGISSSREGESLLYRLQAYLKNSANYGVKYLVTCNYLTEISSRIRQELTDRICLHMKESYDYGEMLGCKVHYLPPDKPGRGLYKYGDTPLEYQCALIRAREDDKEKLLYLKNAIRQICQQTVSETTARRLPVVKEDADYGDFAAQFKKGRIPLGYAVATGTPVALPLKQFTSLGVYLGNPQGRLPIVSNLLCAAQREEMEIWIIKSQADSLFDEKTSAGIDPSGIKNSDYLSSQAEDLSLLLRAIMGTIAQRKEFLQNYCSEHGIGEEEAAQRQAAIIRENTTPIMIFIEDLAAFCSNLDMALAAGFQQQFKSACRWNLYVVACLTPDAPQSLKNHLLFSFFAKNELLMLGGQVDKQFLRAFPNQSNSSKLLPYHTGFMQYRQKTYPILIPCGEVQVTAADEDMESIF